MTRLASRSAIVALGCLPTGSLPALAQQTTLWAAGVPGLMVGQYESRCRAEAQRYAGQGTVQFVNRPGQILGSNSVSCVLTRASRPSSPVTQPASSPVAGVRLGTHVMLSGRLLAVSSLRHNGQLVFFNNQVVARLVAQGGGNLVAQGGGNLVAQGGGNVIVSQGSGNLVAQGGGNIVSTGSGNIQLPNTAGNLVPRR